MPSYCVIRNLKLSFFSIEDEDEKEERRKKDGTMKKKKKEEEKNSLSGIHSTRLEVRTANLFDRIVLYFLDR